MGKSKRRSLTLGVNNQIPNLTREQAIKKAVELIGNKQESMEIISLFGITAEELLEAGATYEDVMALGELIN